MGCFKWFLIILLLLAVLAGSSFLVIQFGAVALWTSSACRCWRQWAQR